MEPIYTDHFQITDIAVDCYGRLKPSMILFYAQEIAGRHCVQLEVDYDTLEKKRLFWAVTRHKVQITRLPTRGETIRIETWPMPTTRVAYPRSMVAYDEGGNELFRSISLWVLMDLDTRNMIPKLFLTSTSAISTAVWIFKFLLIISQITIPTIPLLCAGVLPPSFFTQTG